MISARVACIDFSHSRYLRPISKHGQRTILAFGERLRPCPASQIRSRPAVVVLSFEALEVPGLVQLTIAPINAWSIDTLHDVSENSVGEFERGVVKCKKETETDTPAGSATETYTPSEGPMPSTVSPTGITPGELGPSVPVRGSVTWIREINEDNNDGHAVGHRQLTISFSGSWDPAFPLMKNTSGSWNASMKETNDSHCSSVTTTATGGGALTQDVLGVDGINDVGSVRVEVSLSATGTRKSSSTCNNDPPRIEPFSWSISTLDYAITRCATNTYDPQDGISDLLLVGAAPILDAGATGASKTNAVKLRSGPV